MGCSGVQEEPVGISLKQLAFEWPDPEWRTIGQCGLVAPNLAMGLQGVIPQRMGKGDLGQVQPEGERLELIPVADHSVSQAGFSRGAAPSKLTIWLPCTMIFQPPSTTRQAPRP